MGKRKYAVASKAEIQQAVKALRDICSKARLKEYAFFIAAGIPERTAAISNMTSFRFWTTEHVAMYAEILGVTSEQILGRAPCEAAGRDFGDIFVRNLEDALDEMGYDVTEVVNLLAKAGNRVSSNIKKSMLKNHVMPGRDDARCLMALTGLRMTDMLDWTGAWRSRNLDLTELESAIELCPRKDWVTAPAFASNLKFICKARNVSPSNLLWCLGINDSKRRLSIMRGKSAPVLLLERCAQALHVASEELAMVQLDVQNAPLPAGRDIGELVCQGLRRLIEDSGMQESEVCALANMTAYEPTGMIPATLHTRLEWPYTLLTDSSESYLLALLTVLQVPSMAALYHYAEEAGGVDAPKEEKAPQPNPTRDSPQGEPGGLVQSDITELAPRDLYPDAQIPEGVSFARALAANMQIARPGMPKWTAVAVASEALQYLPPESMGRERKQITLQGIKMYLAGAAVPEKQYQLDAIVRAFFPEADKESMPEYRKRFFAPAMDKAVIPNKQMADTHKHGLTPDGGAVFSTALRRLIRETNTSIPYIAKRMARVDRPGEDSRYGHFSDIRGIETKLEKWQWNLSADEGIDGEDLEALAVIFNVPLSSLTDMPNTHLSAADLQKELKRTVEDMSPEQTVTLYYQLWLADFVRSIKGTV